MYIYFCSRPDPTGKEATVALRRLSAHLCLVTSLGAERQVNIMHWINATAGSLCISSRYLL